MRGIFFYFSGKSYQISEILNIYTINDTEGKLRFANTWKVKEKISLELAKTRLRVGFEPAIFCNQEILSLTHYPLTLNNRKALVTNKTAAYANKLPMQFSTKHK